MSCGKSSEITAFLKGEGSDAERGSQSAHFSTCAECALQLEKTRAVLGSLADLERVDPSPDFTWKVRDAFLRAHPEFLEASPVPARSLWESIRASVSGIPAWAISVSVHVLVVGIAALVFLAPRERKSEGGAPTGPKSGHVAPGDSPGRDAASGPASDVLNQVRAGDRWKAWLEGMPRDAAKGALLAKRGPSGDPAVAKALRWLSEAQSGEGGWGSVEATGLAILAYLADGQTSGPVRKGVEALLAEQRATGLVGSDEGAYLLRHGIASVALLEFAMASGDGRALAAGQAAVAYTVAAQNESGGWGAWARSPESDQAVGAWQILLLRLAELRGEAGVVPALIRAHARLRGAVDARGRLGAPLETAMGMFSLELSSPAADGGILAREEDLLLERPVDGKDLPFALFRSLALFQRGGDGWRKGWAPARLAILSEQRPDGSWGGEAVSTATAALSLETPGRYPRLSE
jgi:hypothetical protein